MCIFTSFPRWEINPADADFCAGEIQTLQAVSSQAAQYLWNTNTAVQPLMYSWKALTVLPLPTSTAALPLPILRWKSPSARPYPPPAVMNFRLGDSILRSKHTAKYRRYLVIEWQSCF